MDTTKADDQNSWFSRNDWCKPLIASLILILAPMTLTTFKGGGGFSLPAWVNVAAAIAGCGGLFFSALRVRLTDTLSARILCAVGVVFGCVAAIWQVMVLL